MSRDINSASPAHPANRVQLVYRRPMVGSTRHWFVRGAEPACKSPDMMYRTDWGTYWRRLSDMNCPDCQLEYVRVAFLTRGD